MVLVAWLMGADPTQLLNMLVNEGGGPAGAAGPSESTPRSAAEEEAAHFVSVVLASTEDAWTRLFRASGSEYRPATLVLYTDSVRSACGFGSAASGPFYCPGDEKIYLDLGFLSELRRLGAPGDFAFAYVIAHEVGHHVQKITGIEPRVRQRQQSASRNEANELSVLMELQADCFSGLWAHHADRAEAILEEGDVQEGLAAAAAIGDDRLQRSAGGEVHPETFTHGTSQQRSSWFRTGLTRGNVDACDTFAAGPSR
jgi:predicted metalloprotease